MENKIKYLPNIEGPFRVSLRSVGFEYEQLQVILRVKYEIRGIMILRDDPDENGREKRYVKEVTVSKNDISVPISNIEDGDMINALYCELLPLVNAFAAKTCHIKDETDSWKEGITERLKKDVELGRLEAAARGDGELPQVPTEPIKD